VTDAGREIGARIVFVCHNSEPHERFPFQESLARRALAGADVLLALSEPVAGELRELVPGIPVEVLAHPPNLRANGNEAGAWSDRIGPIDGPVVLFFGNVRAYKGLEDLVTALPIIRRTVPATLVVAGRFFQSEERLRGLARDLGVSDAVRIFSSYVPANEVSGLFDAADVVALPYRSASQSGIVAQAALYGKPVVATEVGGLPEAIDGRGIVVPPAQPEALAHGLIRALTDPPPAPPMPSADWEDWRAALLSQAAALDQARR
jgi:glycosyltransferase involved in cell wall biosynthesis